MVDHDLVLQPIRREHVNHVQRSVNEALPHIVYKRQPATSATCGKSGAVYSEKLKFYNYINPVNVLL